MKMFKKVKILDEKDKKYFQIKIKQVKHKYNNLTFKGFNINGISTLSENIADIAGFSCVEDFIVTEFPEKLREYSIATKSGMMDVETAEKLAEELDIPLIAVTGDEGKVGALAALGLHDDVDEAVKVYY